MVIIVIDLTKTACESRVDRTVKLRDNGHVTIAGSKLTSLLIKKGQAQERLKRMISDVKNMVTDLRAEELQNATDR